MEYNIHKYVLISVLYHGPGEYLILIGWCALFIIIRHTQSSANSWTFETELPQNMNQHPYILIDS